MNTKILGLQEDAVTFFPKELYKAGPLALFVLLLILWCFTPALLRLIDETTGNIDQSIWLLILLSIMSFMLMITICWWLLQHFWLHAGLPPVLQMVSQFKTLLLWQQLSFYWASFALLLLSALLSLIAIV